MHAEERTVISTLHTLLKRVPERIPERDTRFLLFVTKRVLDAVLQAEQPYNKAEVFQAYAQDVIEQIEQYITQREQETWEDYSTFLYKFVEGCITQSAPKSPSYTQN